MTLCTYIHLVETFQNQTNLLSVVMVAKLTITEQLNVSNWSVTKPNKKTQHQKLY